jgi:alkylation response protein AidB-like acyl-CoA dehydrogenase
MARDFLAKEVVPHFPEWDAAGLIPKDVFRKIGDIGVLGMSIPEQYGGGGGLGFLYRAVWTEEVTRAHVLLGGMKVHTDVVVPYIIEYGTEDQKRRWLPGMASGEIMGAIAMTEPGSGSDLAGMTTTARLDGDCYVLDGAKTFITGGINADLVIVVARTGRGDDRRDGLSLLVVERDMRGFGRGRNLDKIGSRTQDTAELFFDDVRVPVGNLLGNEGAAFRYLTGNLPQERLSIAVTSVAMAEAAIAETVRYVKDRKVFGQPVAAFQNTKFELAACVADTAAARALLDWALLAHEEGRLSAVEAATLKVFCTEVQHRVVDRCLQLHGGYGYIREFPIARMYADARVTRIYGGTTEVLKTIIARSLGL